MTVQRWWAEQAWLGGESLVPSVLIESEDGWLVAVTPGIADPPPSARRLDGLVLPGLANAHSHAFHRALRGRTQSGSGDFWSWRRAMYRVAERLDPESYFRLARATYAEMVLAGFTAVGEFHYLHHGPAGVPYDDPNQMGAALVAAARDAGIRLTLLDTCYLRGGFDAELEGPQRRFGDADVDAWVDRTAQFRVESGAKLGAAIHSVRAVPPEAAARVASVAGERGWVLHAHVSEQRAEHEECQERTGASPLQHLADGEVLSPAFTAVHGTHFGPDDVRLLAGTNGRCCLCPTTERDLGDGVGPVSDLAQAGVRMCLGTDSQAVIDGFEEARALELDGRLVAERRGLTTPARLLESATVDGMDALGCPAGRLEAGRLADFVSVRMSSLRTAGADKSSVATAVFVATAADVHSVVIGGRLVVEDGRHLDLPDPEKELAAVVSALWP